MSVANKLLQAAAGGGSDPVYVEDVFSTHLYDGESSTSTTITINNGLDLADKGGLLWTKSRGGAYPHYLIDSERGHGTGAILYSNLTNAATNSSFSTAFTSTGYTMKGGYDGFSQSSTSYGSPYVSWAFAKQEKFFDIVTYTGNGTAGRTISHNLGSVPGMMIVKATSDVSEWVVYHRSLGNTKYLHLEQTHQVYTSNARWNDTTPTDTVFTVGTTPTNTNGTEYVAYLFAHDEQEFGENSDEAIIKCGSFTTTSTWGNFKEDLGFEPQWLLVKRTDSADNWIMLDMMRGVAGPGDQALVDTGMFSNASDDAELQANANSAESLQGRGGFYSKGYIGNLGGFGNATYIYVAIRRPQKPASELAATDLFTLQAKSPGEGADTFISTGFNVDTVMYRSRATSATVLGDRLRGQAGGPDLVTTASDTEGTNTGAFFLDNSNGVTVDYSGGHFNVSPAATDKNYIRYFLRRAKGFYDVVCYVGTGSATTFNHNLGVTPELMWIKSRSGAADSWVVWDKNADLSTSTPLFSDMTQARRYPKQSVNATAPTASVFSVGAAGYSTNTSGVNYIVYLFASVAGISKIGTYSGTGSNVNVDCGFSAGARFVLIWRTDSSGPGWYVYDSARGIVAGNDPYSLLGSTATEVTNTDYIDPDNSGFIVTSSAPDALNASGGSYIFLAIA